MKFVDHTHCLKYNLRKNHTSHINPNLNTYSYIIHFRLKKKKNI